LVLSARGTLQTGRTYHDVTLDVRILTRFDTARSSVPRADSTKTQTRPAGAAPPSPDTGARP
jgi:hypothetical protein